MTEIDTRAIATLALLCLATVFMPERASAQINPQVQDADKLYPGKTYSPYAQRAFPSEVYWGDTHLHTGLSLDAGLFGNTLTPDDAYRYAKGEPLLHAAGYQIQLKGPPLDFIAVTDHAEYMGVVEKMADECHPLYWLPLAQKVRSPFWNNQNAAFQQMLASMTRLLWTNWSRPCGRIGPPSPTYILTKFGPNPSSP